MCDCWDCSPTLFYCLCVQLPLFSFYEQWEVCRVLFRGTSSPALYQYVRLHSRYSFQAGTFTRITHAEAHGAIPFTKVTSASQVPHRCINPERLLKRQITSLIRREVRPPDSIARVSFTSSFIRYHNSLWASILSRFSCAMGKRDKNREKPAARHRMPRNFVPALVRDRRRWYNKIKKIGHVVRKE